MAVGMAMERQWISPDFTRRLRRARVGFFILIVWVSMLFVSFTSAYVVRKGMPSLNQNTNQMGIDWIQVNLPVRVAGGEYHFCWS